jgi:hypothetical protein
MDSPFYRVELSGERVGVEYAEVHALRKDILLYFDENVAEATSILLAEGQYQLPYWQYLSLSFEEEWAESAHYQRLVEEGCLALVNGIALDLLDQPLGRLDNEWPGGSVPRVLLYLGQYRPTSPKGATAKAHLVRTFSFIESLSPADIDENGMLIHFDPSLAGRWFNQELVRSYFQWRVANLPS